MRTNTKTQEQSNLPSLLLVGGLTILIAVIAVTSYLTNGSL